MSTGQLAAHTNATACAGPGHFLSQLTCQRCAKPSTPLAYAARTCARTASDTSAGRSHGRNIVVYAQQPATKPMYPHLPALFTVCRPFRVGEGGLSSLQAPTLLMTRDSTYNGSRTTSKHAADNGLGLGCWAHNISVWRCGLRVWRPSYNRHWPMQGSVPRPFE